MIAFSILFHNLNYVPEIKTCFFFNLNIMQSKNRLSSISTCKLFHCFTYKCKIYTVGKNLIWFYDKDHSTRDVHNFRMAPLFLKSVSVYLYAFKIKTNETVILISRNGIDFYELVFWRMLVFLTQKQQWHGKTITKRWRAYPKSMYMT